MELTFLATLMFLISFLQIIECHYPKYGAARNITCYVPKPAKIASWHIHLLFHQTNANHTKGAFDIRNKFNATFHDRIGPQCKDLFDEDHLCMFEPDIEPIWPFLTAQWSIFVTNEDLTDMFSWFIQNRGIYDILIHPNTGCEMEDHSDWVVWG